MVAQQSSLLQDNVPTPPPTASAPARLPRAVVAWVAAGMTGALALGTVLGGSAGAVAGGLVAAKSRPASAAVTSAAVARSVPLAANGTVDLATLYQQVAPSVVYIEAQLARGTAVGSGFVIDKDGQILTNNHVVTGARSLSVRFTDGTTARATVVGTDPQGDIALIRVQGVAPEHLQPVTLGDSSAVRPGDLAVAIGNPLGLESTITAGIISAVDRTQSEGNGRSLYGLLQTDAAINQGNSGGPLLNARGEVIGINTLGLISEGAQNVSFAIPINTVKNLLPRLQAGEVITHAYLGVLTQSVAQAKAAGANISVERGVYLAGVQASSPAARAGLRTGDVLTALNGQPLDNPDQLGQTLDAYKPGETITVTFLRNGQTQTVNVTLGRAPSA